MHRSNTFSSHTHGRSHARYESEANDNMPDTDLSSRFAVRDIFRSKTVHHHHHTTHSASSQPPQNSASGTPFSRSVSQRNPRHLSHEPQPRGRPQHRRERRSSDPAKPESAPPPPPSGRAAAAAGTGTRGYFVPPYRSAEHFAQLQRLTNPTRPLATSRAQRSDPSRVTVGFYHCQHLSFGREYLASPDVRRLLSAAVAFLGECELRDTPLASQPERPNTGYRGLALEGSHGYHLHLPDFSGARPFSRTVSIDWERVLRIHARESPRTVLLVGVGSGEPGAQCCST